MGAVAGADVDGTGVGAGSVGATDGPLEGATVDADAGGTVDPPVSSSSPQAARPPTANTTQITDAAINDLKIFSKLEQLYLHDTYITPKGRAELKEALPNTKLFGYTRKP